MLGVTGLPPVTRTLLFTDSFFSEEEDGGLPGKRRGHFAGLSVPPPPHALSSMPPHPFQSSGKGFCGGGVARNLWNPLPKASQFPSDPAGAQRAWRQ